MESTKPKMVYRKLGKTGLNVSVIGFGPMVISEQEVMNSLVKEAFARGVNYFDTAEFYTAGKNEIIIGNAFKENKIPREDIVISTKIFFGISQEKNPLACKTKQGPFGPCDINSVGLSRKHVIEGCNASLKRLQTDYVDVIFASRPDVHTPMEEICRAFNYLIEKGKAFYWGTSEWEAKQIRDAIGVCEKLGLTKPIVEQCQYSMLVRDAVERDLKELCLEYGLGTTVWAPLARGILAGKYNKEIPKNSRYEKSPQVAKDRYFSWLEEDKIDKTRELSLKLEALAKELGMSQSHLALCWAVRSKCVSSAIMGTSTLDQLTDNLNAIEHLDKITSEVEEKIEKILGTQPDSGFDYRELRPKKATRDLV